MASIKVKTGSTSWTTYSKAFIKNTSSVWKTVKKIYMQNAAGWALLWPVAGPYTTESPIIRLHTYRSTSTSGSQPPTDVGSVIQMGPGGTRGQAVTIADGESGSTFLWGYDGTWASNASAVITRQFYYNSSNDFTSANVFPGVTDTVANTSGGIGLRDEKYVWYYVEQTNSTGTGSDNSQPLFIIKQKPAAPSTFAITAPSIATVGVPIEVSYAIQNDTTYWYKNADLSKSYIEWFAESSTTANPTNLISGSKVLLSSLSSSYSFNTSFTPTVSQAGKYIHAKITLINSYSTYYSDYSVTSVSYTTSAVQQSTPPTVNSYPTLSGTPSAFALITAAAGSYSNYASVTTEVVTRIGTSPTQGSNDDYTSGVKSSNPYTVTQSDATNVSYTFYARDTVSGTDGKTYYYYSSGKKSDMGVVSDDFSNRTTTNGIGTMSSGYQYTGPSVTPYASGLSWRVASGYGISSTAVGSSDGPSMWPLRSIEMGGNTSVYATVDFPGASGGLGVAFWAASATQWWSARCFHISEIGIVESCTGTGGTNTTGAPTSPSTGVGSACNISTGSEYQCQSTTYTTSTSITNSTSAGGYCNVSSNIGYNCLSTIYGNGATEPTTGTGAGAKCNSYSTVTTTYACDQTGGSGTTSVTVGTGSGAYCNQTSVITYACGTAVSSYTTTQTTGTGPNDRCYESTTTTYPCQIAEYNSTTAVTAGDGPGAYCRIYTTLETTYACDGASGGTFTTKQTQGSAQGAKCGESAGTAYACVGSVSGRSACGSLATTPYISSDVGMRCGTCFGTGSARYYSVVASVTTYSYLTRSTEVNTTRYYFSFRSSAATTTYNYTFRSTTGTTTYYWDKRSTTATNTTLWFYSLRDTTFSTTYTYSLRSNSPTTTYTWNTVASSNTTQYNTYVKIAAAENGSTVNEKGSLKVDSSTSSYPAVYGVTASISGNSITAWLKDSVGSAIGGTLTITPSSPVKADSNGASAAGIIKGYSPAFVGTSFDNLLII